MQSNGFFISFFFTSNMQQVWCEMLERSPKTHLGSVTIPFLNTWLGMMMMPACSPIDHTALVHALHRTQNKVIVLLQIFCYKYVNYDHPAGESSPEKDCLGVTLTDVSTT